MAGIECKDCTRTNGRPTILGVGWCGLCKKAAAGTVVNEKRRSAVNPRYATQLPSNAVAIFNKAVKKICSVKTRSVASPSKVPSSGVSARLPPSTSPERPMVNRAALKPVVTASKNIKFSDRAFHDASVLPSECSHQLRGRVLFIHADNVRLRIPANRVTRHPAAAAG